jgi:hypothetical protein
MFVFLELAISNISQKLNNNYIVFLADVAVQTICSILEQEEEGELTSSCPRVKLKSRDPQVNLNTGEGMETLPEPRDQDVKLKSRDQEVKTSDEEAASPESRDPEETESRDPEETESRDPEEVRLKSRDQEEGTLLKREKEEGEKKSDRLQQFLNFSLQVIVTVPRLIAHLKTQLVIKSSKIRFKGFGCENTKLGLFVTTN